MTEVEGYPLIGFECPECEHSEGNEFSYDEYDYKNLDMRFSDRLCINCGREIRVKYKNY